ncbi:MAG: hypothetical protein LBR53_03225 [Deltaproteobacteria bacterium]|nr:hypothetical protein [Deltaproteobacteria bacterium]
MFFKLREGIRAANLAAQGALERLKAKDALALGSLEDVVKEAEARLSVAKFLEKVLEHPYSGILENISAVSEPIHPSRRDDFKNGLLGVLVYGSLIYMDVEWGLKAFREIPPLRPEDMEGPLRRRFKTRAVAAYNLVYLLTKSSDDDSAKDVLRELRDMAAHGQAVLLREELAGGEASIPEFHPQKYNEFSPFIPELPLFRAPHLSESEAEALGQEEPFVFKSANYDSAVEKPTLSTVMRRAAGLGPPGSVSRAGDKGKDQMKRELLKDAAFSLDLFFQASAISCRFFQGFSRPDEGWERFKQAEAFRDPRCLSATVRFARMTYELVSRVPQIKELDGLCRGLLESFEGLGEHAPRASKYYAWSVLLYVNRFIKRKPGLETLPYFKKVMALESFKEIEIIQSYVAITVSKALGGGRGLSSETFPGPALPDDNFAAMRDVYEALLGFSGTSAGDRACAELRRDLLVAAIASDRRDLVDQILEDILDVAGDMERLTALSAVSVYHSRAGRLPEAEALIIAFGRQHEVAPQLFHSWSFAAVELIQAHSRENNSAMVLTLSKHLEKQLKRCPDDEMYRALIHPLRKFMSAAIEVKPKRGGVPVFRLVDDDS